MMHDFGKPQPHVASRENMGKELPVYIFVIVGAVPCLHSCLYGCRPFR